jgi:hypothetical protein
MKFNRYFLFQSDCLPVFKTGVPDSVCLLHFLPRFAFPVALKLDNSIPEGSTSPGCVSLITRFLDSCQTATAIMANNAIFMTIMEKMNSFTSGRKFTNHPTEEYKNFYKGIFDQNGIAL